MPAQLNQILAIEKGIKTRVYGEFTALHKATQKADLMNGFKKTFEPKEEGGETFPSENKLVQFSHRDVFEAIRPGLADLINIIATKDFTNCGARANVEVDGQILIKDCPTTHLLFLEKQLQDLHTFVVKMAELDPGEEWTWDTNSGYHKTGQIKQHRTKKMQRALVLVHHSKEHPAQTQMITEDVIIGYWNTVKISGAVKRTEKRKLLKRIEKLTNAVKMARQAANTTEVKNQHHGKVVMDFIFA